MKSKISFFNKTIFMKNLTLYWPIWGVYTLVLLCMHPVLFWLNTYYSSYYGYYNKEDAFVDMMRCLYTEPATVVIAIAAVVMGLALYHYLYNHKSANMIHSLPVDRNQLFGTNVLSGLTFLIVPLFISAVFMTILALANGITAIGYIWIWFLLLVGTAFSAFSIVTFCAMVTGHTAALPVYVLIFNFLPMWAYGIVYVVIVCFGYAVENIGQGVYRIIEYFSPLGCFLYNVGMNFDYNEMGEAVGVRVDGGWIVAIYVFASIVLLAIAHRIYKKRQIESAGDFITVEWLKPVFRWGVGMSTGIFGGLFIYEVLNAMRIGCDLVPYIFIMLLLGIAGYFAADMLINKSFHVFKKKNWRGCGGFLVILLVTFLGLYGASEYYENYVPELDEVKTARISLGYEIELEGEEAEQIIKLHKALLEHNDYCEEFSKSGNWEYDFLMISYTLENGDYINRAYYLPYEYEEIESIVSEVLTLEDNVDNLLEYLLCENYDKVTEFNYASFNAEYLSDVEQDDVSYEDITYENYELNQEETEILYQAVIADIKEGTMIKYNKYMSRYEGVSVDKAANIYLEFEFKNPNVEFESYEEYEDYMNQIDDWSDAEEYWIYSDVIFIGPDCENTVNALIELRIIESIDDIHWGEQN